MISSAFVERVARTMAEIESRVQVDLARSELPAEMDKWSREDTRAYIAARCEWEDISEIERHARLDLVRETLIAMESMGVRMTDMNTGEVEGR